jgi:hypothetical protein
MAVRFDLGAVDEAVDEGGDASGVRKDAPFREGFVAARATFMAMLS